MSGRKDEGINGRKTKERERRGGQGERKRLIEWTEDVRYRHGFRDEFLAGWTLMPSLGLWSSLCTYRLSLPSVATLHSLFSPSLQRKYFHFLSFYRFII